MKIGYLFLKIYFFFIYRQTGLLELEVGLSILSLGMAPAQR